MPTESAPRQLHITSRRALERRTLAVTPQQWISIKAIHNLAVYLTNRIPFNAVDVLC